MKTKNLILSIALVALTTTLFANEPTVNAQCAETFTEEELGLESWMVVPFEDAIFESELVIELWMVTPFEDAISESELVIESWMTTPFENMSAEEEVVIESWMTAPFEVVDSIEIEYWMAAAWI